MNRSVDLNKTIRANACVYGKDCVFFCTYHAFISSRRPSNIYICIAFGVVPFDFGRGWQFLFILKNKRMIINRNVIRELYIKYK